MASTSATTTGNWNDASKWSNGVPTINDDATINSGVTITVPSGAILVIL